MTPIARPRTRSLLAEIVTLLGFATAGAYAQEPRELIQAADGREAAGKVESASAGRFQFVPADGSPPLPLEDVRHVDFAGAEMDLRATTPPFHVLLGEDGRISGSLRSITPETIELETAANRPPLKIDR